MMTILERIRVFGSVGVRFVVLLCLFCTFRAFNGFVVLGSSVNVRHCSSSHTPKHITLAVGNDPSTEMIITFASISSYNPSPPIAGVIVSRDRTAIEQIMIQKQYNTTRKRRSQPILLFLEDRSLDSPTSYNITVAKSSLSNDNGVGKKYFSSYYHHITMTGLEPTGTYYYMVMYHQDINSFDPILLEQFLVNPSSTIMLDKDEIVQQYRDVNENLIKSTEETSTASCYDENTSTLLDCEDNTRQRRNLIRWGPYNPLNHACPNPNKIRSFRTAPKPGEYFTKTKTTSSGELEEQPRSVNIAIMGDLGQFPHSEETASKLRESIDDIDTILIVGDIAYDEYDHRRWDTFLDFLDDFEIVHNTPMQIVPGNHDIDKLANDDNIFLGYEHRFRMPRVHPPLLGKYTGNVTGMLDMDIPPYPLPYEWGNAYYSYTYGPARILMISAYSSMEPDSIQYEWIIDELEAVNRTVTPWVLAILHTPLYNTFSLHHHDLQIFAARQHLEPLFIHHNVNLIFTGHIHAYLRTSGVAYNDVDETGPIHITVGASGRDCNAPFNSATKESWVEVRDATFYGYGMLRIFNDTVSEWEWIHSGGLADKHPHYNELYHDNTTQLPPGPKIDRVLIQNQFYL